jgi:hypothetical protein
LYVNRSIIIKINNDQYKCVIESTAVVVLALPNRLLTLYLLGVSQAKRFPSRSRRDPSILFLFFFIFIFLISRYFGVVFCIHCVWLPRWMIDITTEREVAEFVFLFFSLLNIFSQGIKSEKKKKKIDFEVLSFPS